MMYTTKVVRHHPRESHGSLADQDIHHRGGMDAEGQTEQDRTEARPPPGQPEQQERQIGREEEPPWMTSPGVRMPTPARSGGRRSRARGAGCADPRTSNA